MTGNQYSIYGIQYKPGFDDAVSLKAVSWRAAIHETFVASTLAGLRMASLLGPSSKAVSQRTLGLKSVLGLCRKSPWHVHSLDIVTWVRADFYTVPDREPGNVVQLRFRRP